MPEVQSGFDDGARDSRFCAGDDLSRPHPAVIAVDPQQTVIDIHGPVDTDERIDDSSAGLASPSHAIEKENSPTPLDGSKSRASLTDSSGSISMASVKTSGSESDSGMPLEISPYCSRSLANYTD